MPSNNAYFLDLEYWELLYLQKFSTEDLSKTGHSDRKMISVEATLKACEPKANGKVYTLTTS